MRYTTVNLPNLSQWQQISGFTRDIPHHVQPQYVGSEPETIIPDHAHPKIMPHVEKEDLQASKRYSDPYNPGQ